MFVTPKIETLQAQLSQERAVGAFIGFVPTMGYLHEGHLALVRRSKAENDITVVSIFVNPVQFNNAEDLEKYPRDLERDLALLEGENTDMVFVPETREMYPDEQHQVYDLGLLDTVMEGLHRPGHFQGVARVVHRLFDIVKPDRAYFGMKDFQQLQVIHRLVDLEKLNILVIPCETVREPDGLAMSSRNVRLGVEERRNAPLIYQALQHAIQLRSVHQPEVVAARVADRLKAIPGFTLEYFEIADAMNMQPLKNWSDSTAGAVGCVAGYLGGVRLIDNVLL